MILPVTSPDNQYVKLAASLKQKKFRDATGFFSIEGLRLAKEAVASGWELQFALVSEREKADGGFDELLFRLDGRACQVIAVTAALYKKISDTETPQGILLVLKQKQQVFPEIPSAVPAPWLVLDSLQDPGNVGTIIRTADAAGAAGVMLAGECADVYAGKTTRAAMGSLFHLPVIKASASDCLGFFDRHGIPVYVSGAEATSDYRLADLTGAFAVVLGNEGAGVGEAFRSRVPAAIGIPLQGKAESLNVASAAAVILFEAARQRQFQVSCKSNDRCDIIQP